MTTIGHRARQPHREASTHLFAVGQLVRLRDGFGRPALPVEIYRITGTLPPRGNSPQYRIRSDDERHERVTTQDSLELVVMPQAGDDANLLERTFGHGQGTETQQSRDPKAEAGKGTGQA